MTSPAARAFAATKQENAESLGAEIDKLTEEIESLRAQYEQYFLGIERRPPTLRHDQLKRRVVKIQTSTVKQTAVKFKAQALNARMITYERLWTRTLNEIEQGIYRRDLFKARLHRKEQEEKKKKKVVVSDEEVNLDDLEHELAQERAEVENVLNALDEDDEATNPELMVPAALREQELAKATMAPPQRIPTRTVVAPPRPSAPVGAAGSISDAKMKQIFEAYVTAKKRCNEDTSNLSYDSVASTLRSQVPELMKQHKAKSVEFKVVIKDGKAVLRALPKE